MIQTVRGELGRPRTAVPCPDFDLALTLNSGQVFRWRQGLSPRQKTGGQAKGTVPFFTGWIGGSPARVSQEGDRLLLDGVSSGPARRFFALDLDLPAITRQMDVDPVIYEALRRYPGLRVIRQDPWECAASFMLSAYNNIPRLTAMLERLSCFALPVSGFAPLGPSTERSTRKAPARTSKSLTHLPCSAKPATIRPGAGVDAQASRKPSGHGSPVSLKSGESEAESEAGRHGGAAEPSWADTHAPQAGDRPFPRPEVLANVSERALRNCGLGYRAPYLKGMAQMAASGRAELERWRELEDEELRRTLLTLPGIGEKVVECVMLFAYGRSAAFPVDIWIGRAMRAWYFRRRKVSDKKIREFARKHFGPHCGWAQQYLYCFARLGQEPKKGDSR